MFGQDNPLSNSLSVTAPFDTTQSPIVIPDDEPGTLTESQDRELERDKERARELFGSIPCIDPSYLNAQFPHPNNDTPVHTPSSVASAVTPASAGLELPTTITTPTGKRKRDGEGDPELSHFAIGPINDERLHAPSIVIEALQLFSPQTISPQRNLSSPISLPDERPTKRVRTSATPIQTVTASSSIVRTTSIQPPQLPRPNAFEPTPKIRRVFRTFVSEDSRDLHEWLNALFGVQSDVRGQTARLNKTKCFICKFTDPTKADATQSTMKRHVLSHFQETLKVITRYGGDEIPYRQIMFIHHMIPTLQRMGVERHITISVELQREIEIFLRDHASIVPVQPFPVTLTFDNQNMFSITRFPNLYKTAKAHARDLLGEHSCQCGVTYGRRDLLKKHVKSKLLESQRKKTKGKSVWNHGRPGRTGADCWEDFGLTSSGEEINQKRRANAW